jgi:hypothetical protein
VKLVLKSFGIGMAGTVVLLGIAAVGIHTPFELITLPFVMPLTVLAGVTAYAITKGQAGSRWETIQLYGLMILFGGLIYGFMAFLVLRMRKNSN